MGICCCERSQLEDPRLLFKRAFEIYIQVIFIISLYYSYVTDSNLCDVSPIFHHSLFKNFNSTGKNVKIPNEANWEPMHGNERTTVEVDDFPPLLQCVVIYLLATKHNYILRICKFSHKKTKKNFVGCDLLYYEFCLCTTCCSSQLTQALAHQLILLPLKPLIIEGVASRTRPPKKRLS
mgnify:CR=1 FL=1